MEENSVPASQGQSAFENFTASIQNLSPISVVLIVIVGLLFLNTLYVDYKLLFSPPPLDATQIRTITSQAACSPSCVSTIDNKLSQIPATTGASFVAQEISTEPTNSPTPTRPPTPTLIPPYTPTTTPIAQPKEFFIPLGTGSGSSTSWTSLDGVGATVNIANYPNIANIYFEVTLRIPTGNQTASVRLYNSTTSSPISSSTLTSSGGTSTLLTSSPITLPAGNNTYQVQLQTQLGYTTYIDQARIHIITN